MIPGAIVLAFICWAITFGLSWGNFWIKIGVSVIIICLYSFIWQKPRFQFTLSNTVIGILSAVVLYGIFYLGNLLAPFIVKGAEIQVGGIYSLGVGTSRVFVFLLLCFITGPGEEIFWRGFLQKRLMEHFGPAEGFVLGILLYSGVHIFSTNFILIMAALVAGAFWGGLYLWKRDLGLVIVSHSLWSAFIFAVFPIQ